MQNHWCVWVVVAGLGLSAACTKQVNVCHQDSDCGDVAYPFCDVNGEYPASGGEKGVCTITPPNCPAERCGCTPNATTCTNNELSVCQTDGMSTTTTSCDLGCSSDGTHCLGFAPLNGLSDALAMADGEPDVEIPNLDTISTNGQIASDLGAQFSVKSILLAQSNGKGLRVFIAKSFIIHAAQLRGDDNAIAFVSSGPITIDGLMDASAYRAFGGPGALRTNSACAGVSGAYGGGGGGNGTAGGNGSPIAQLPPAPGAPGGAAQTDTFEPIGGGCSGGDEAGMSYVGIGGGALQFVSRTSLTVATTGIVDVGGGGGGDAAGGGAGGTVLIESPTVTIDGAITANGGAGGACGNEGTHSTPDATPAAGVGGCSTTMSGSGATGVAAPTDGAHGGYMAGAGGGGAAGRLGIRTRDGTYGHASGALLSAKTTAGMLDLK